MSLNFREMLLTRDHRAGEDRICVDHCGAVRKDMQFYVKKDRTALVHEIITIREDASPPYMMLHLESSLLQDYAAGTLVTDKE